ncbi:MAG: replicative DNA helicase [Gammaproteobacteria bacterium]|nr:replicative DNA helicase [Gammaproteobacteria bacterium]
MLNHSRELHAEQALLGSLLSDNSAWDDIGDFLHVDDFSLPFHRNTFRVIQNLLMNGKHADVICVSQKLTETDEHSPDPFILLCEILNGQYASQNIKLYAEIIKQNSIDRKMITAAQDIITSVREQKENRLDNAQKLISEVADQTPSEITLITDILRDVLDSIDQRQTSKSEISGLPTGFCDLDKITHGLQKGDLIILAARPSMGKTLLAMNIAEHVAIIEKKPVAIFSLEMSKEQLLERSLTSIARVKADQMRAGNLDVDDFKKITNAIPKFQEAKLFIDDRSLLSVADIRTKCRRIMREHKLSLIVIDYIGLMYAEGENETLKMGNISRGLKLLARDLNVPVIAISQLNRAVEQRNDKHPCMADIRQSGAIEQDADLILFIYRDEVYNDKSHLKGMAEIIIAKHRNGNIGKINLSFNSQNCRFDNFDGVLLNPSQPEKVWRGQPFTYNKDL